MLIYIYDENTLEYLYSKEADKDPVASRKAGIFVPLLPPNATKVKPPKLKEDQTCIFEDNVWKVIVDYRQNYIKVDKDLNIYPITEYGYIEDDYCLVTKELGNDIQLHRNEYKIVNKHVVKKTHDELLQELKEKKKLEALRLAKLFIESGNAIYEFQKNKHIEATDGNIAKLIGYKVAFSTNEIKDNYIILWNTKEDETVFLTKDMLDNIIEGLNNIQTNIWTVQYTTWLKIIEEMTDLTELENLKIVYKGYPNV